MIIYVVLWQLGNIWGACHIRASHLVFLMRIFVIVPYSIDMIQTMILNEDTKSFHLTLIGHGLTIQMETRSNLGIFRWPLKLGHWERGLGEAFTSKTS